MKRHSKNEQMKTWKDEKIEMKMRWGPFKGGLKVGCWPNWDVSRDAGTISEARDSAKETELFKVWERLNCWLWGIPVLLNTRSSGLSLGSAPGQVKSSQVKWTSSPFTLES